jgi:hypothetical protein
MRARHILTGLLALAACGWATTLEQLSMADMIQKSTAIVRAKVTGSNAASRNGTIYTFYHLQVLENLKASTPSSVDVAVPGGALGNVSQSVAGAPVLRPGAEYVLFLWTSKSGLTQIIGLSQGAFDAQTTADGKTVLTRPGISERMLDSQGRPVIDRGLSLDLNDLRGRVRQGGSRQ